MPEETLGEELERLHADNARLRLLLDKADAPAELRHRLRSTIALLRQIVMRSADRAVDVGDYVAHLLDRIDAISHAQSTADDRGAIDLHTLVAETLHRYRVIEGERLRLSGPAITFHPKPGQALALAIHELAMNAIQHGSLGAEQGHLEVAWAIEDSQAGPVLSLAWRETGSMTGTPPGAPGFGSEVLNNLLPYELKAIVSWKPSNSGVDCVIQMPWHERLGAVHRAASPAGQERS